MGSRVSTLLAVAAIIVGTVACGSPASSEPSVASPPTPTAPASPVSQGTPTFVPPVLPSPGRARSAEEVGEAAAHVVAFLDRLADLPASGRLDAILAEYDDRVDAHFEWESDTPETMLLYLNRYVLALEAAADADYQAFDKHVESLIDLRDDFDGLAKQAANASP